MVCIFSAPTCCGTATLKRTYVRHRTAALRAHQSCPVPDVRAWRIDLDDLTRRCWRMVGIYILRAVTLSRTRRYDTTGNFGAMLCLRHEVTSRACRSAKPPPDESTTVRPHHTVPTLSRVSAPTYLTLSGSCSCWCRRGGSIHVEVRHGSWRMQTNSVGRRIM